MVRNEPKIVAEAGLADGPAKETYMTLQSNVPLDHFTRLGISM